MARGKFNKNHPELGKGEVFLTNASDDSLLDRPERYSGARSSWETVGWKTKRKGIVAYDVYGKSIDGMFPVFVQREELVLGGIDPDNLFKDIY